MVLCCALERRQLSGNTQGETTRLDALNSRSTGELVLLTSHRNSTTEKTISVGISKKWNSVTGHSWRIHRPLKTGRGLSTMEGQRDSGHPLGRSRLLRGWTLLVAR